MLCIPSTSPSLSPIFICVVMPNAGKQCDLPLYARLTRTWNGQGVSGPTLTMLQLVLLKHTRERLPVMPDRAAAHK